MAMRVVFDWVRKEVEDPGKKSPIRIEIDDEGSITAEDSNGNTYTGEIVLRPVLKRGTSTTSSATAPNEVLAELCCSDKTCFPHPSKIEKIIKQEAEKIVNAQKKKNKQKG
jgi:hypothetical protein